MIDSASHPESPGSQHVLVSDRDLRTTVLLSALISVGIIFWLIRLRADALDITFERIFFGLFLFQDYAIALCAFLVLVLALLPISRKLGTRSAQLLGGHPIATAIVYTGLLAVGAILVYHKHPLSMDEYSPYFQSQVFAAGELAGRYPLDLLDWLIPKAFHNYFLNVSYEDGRVVTSYWPGFALLLTPFTAAGVPWLCNPVLSGLGLLIIHRLALRLFESVDHAGLAMLLALSAPAFAINGMSFYSMQAHLICNAAFALCLLSPNPRRAFAAGLIGSLALTLHNPVPHALFALPWILWMLSARERRAFFAMLVLGYLPLCLLLGVGWAWFSSSVASFPAAGESQTFISALMTKLDAAFSVPSEGLLRARVIGIAKLILWSVPAAVVFALFGVRRFRHDFRIQLFAWSALVTFAGYLIVPFDQGHGWGFRYVHSVWFAIPLLAVAFTLRMSGTCRTTQVSNPTFGFLAGCGVLSLLMVVTTAAYQVEGFISRHLAYLPNSTQGETRLVIVSPGMGYYSTDLVQNDPFLRSGITTLITHGRIKDAQLVAQRFPSLGLLSIDHRGSAWGWKQAERSAPPTAPDDHAEQE